MIDIPQRKQLSMTPMPESEKPGFYSSARSSA
jgi:hypothetical protein